MAVDIEQPILWEAVEDAISQWITDTLGIATQWADQDAPQPARPFVEMSIDGPIELGVDDEKRTIETAPGSDDWQEQTRGEREITIGLQVEVDAASSRDARRHARALASRLFASLTIDSLTKGLEDAGLSYRARNPILDTSIPLADEFVARATFEYRAGLASCVVEDIDVIESAEIEGQVSGRADGIGTTTVTIDIDSTP